MYRRGILALSVLLLVPAAWPQMHAGGSHGSAGRGFHGGVVVSRGSSFGGVRFGTRFHAGFRGGFFFAPGFRQRRFPIGFPLWYYAYPAYCYADYSDTPGMYGAYDRSSIYEQNQELL